MTEYQFESNQEIRRFPNRPWDTEEIFEFKRVCSAEFPGSEIMSLMEFELDKMMSDEGLHARILYEDVYNMGNGKCLAVIRFQIWGGKK